MLRALDGTITSIGPSFFAYFNVHVMLALAKVDCDVAILKYVDVAARGCRMIPLPLGCC